jgi:hypothetical protein
MAKKRPKKVAPVQKITNIGRIGELTAITNLNKADSEKRRSNITDLNKELLEYYKLAHGIKKLEQAKLSTTDVESKFEKILQSKLSNKEEVAEELPINRQETSDSATIIDMEI